MNKLLTLLLFCIHMNNYNFDGNVCGFVKFANKKRLENKNKRFTISGHINNLYFEMKNYGTYLQIYKVNGINHAGSSDMGIAERKNKLEEGVMYHLSV